MLLSLTICSCQNALTAGRPTGSSKFIDFEDLNDGNTVLYKTNMPDKNQQSHIMADLNDDGYLDVAWIDPYAYYQDGSNSASENYGKIYILFGKEEGFGAEPDFAALNASEAVTIWGPGRLAGCATSSCRDNDYTMRLYVEDLNGDDINDLIVASPSTEDDQAGNQPGNAGRINVIFGVQGDWNTSLDLSDKTTYSGYTFWPEHNVSGMFGNRVVTADFNNDSYLDIAVADEASRSGAGAVYILYGKASGHPDEVRADDLNGTDGVIIQTQSADNTMMMKLFADDLNDDNIADLIIQQPAEDANDDARFYIVFGDKSLSSPFNLADLNGSTGFEIVHSGLGPVFQDAVITGDFNHDGISDLAFGLPKLQVMGKVGAGAVYVVFGSSTRSSGSLDVTTFNGTDGFVLVGDIDNRYVGWNLNKGDFNGDGMIDLAFSMPGAADIIMDGKVGVLYGSSGPFNSSYDANSEFLNGTHGVILESSGFFKVNYIKVADYNQDGIDDLILFPLGYNFYVVYGRPYFSSPYNVEHSKGIDGFQLRITREVPETQVGVLIPARLLDSQPPPPNPDSFMINPMVSKVTSNGVTTINLLLDINIIQESVRIFKYCKLFLSSPPKCKLGSSVGQYQYTLFVLDNLTLDAANFFIVSPGCHPLYSNGELTYSWTCTQAGSSDPCLDVDDAAITLTPDDAKQLTVKGNVLKPGQNLDFKLKVMYGDMKSTSIIKVDTQCTAQVTNFMLPKSPMILDVLEIENINLVSQAQISYAECQDSTNGWTSTWSCVVKGTTDPCMDTSGDQLSPGQYATNYGLTIPEKTLEPNQKLMFEVTMTSGGTSQTRSVEVHTVTYTNNAQAVGLGLGFGLGLGIPTTLLVVGAVIFKVKGLAFAAA